VRGAGWVEAPVQASWGGRRGIVYSSANQVFLLLVASGESGASAPIPDSVCWGRDAGCTTSTASESWDR
jgi:hypothetical protein